MSLLRTLAIAAADLRARLRRPATLVFLALLLAAASTTFPDPSSGRGILTIGGRRAVYTSAALAVATAGILPFLLGLFGFYAVSNAVALDRRSGAGPLLGATPMRSSEYLLGKLLGNLGLLSVVTLAFAVVVMAVQVVHGEAPLEPLVFLSHLLVVALPALFAVSTFALLFECVPFLSGRFGDVAFFFVWLVVLSMPVFRKWRAACRRPSRVRKRSERAVPIVVPPMGRIPPTDDQVIGTMRSPPATAPS